jgi:hypothetical protein
MLGSQDRSGGADAGCGGLLAVVRDLDEHRDSPRGCVGEEADGAGHHLPAGSVDFAAERFVLQAAVDGRDREARGLGSLALGLAGGDGGNDQCVSAGAVVLGSVTLGHVPAKNEQLLGCAGYRERVRNCSRVAPGEGLATNTREEVPVPGRLIPVPSDRARDAPTAIFAASDVQAPGVIAAARRRGLRVPEDLSVIGFDDIELAGHVGLATVRQYLQQSGEVAARMLMAMLRGETLPQREVLLLLSVVPRNSTAVRDGR